MMSKKIVVSTSNPHKSGNSFAITGTFIPAAQVKVKPSPALTPP